LHGVQVGPAPSLEDALRFYAEPSQELIAEALRNALSFGKPFDLELELNNTQGARLWVRMQGEARMHEGTVNTLHGAIQDITQSKLDAIRIYELAFVDPVTELANRRLLMDRLQVALAACLRYQRHGAMLAIDMDGFTLLNESLGHAKGDMLLRAVATEILQKVRNGDTVARIGADEFVVLLTDLSSNLEEALAQTRTVADKLLDCLFKSYLLDGVTHYGSASMGVTLFGETSENLEEPMKRADLALAQAKASGGNSISFFEPPMQAMIERRIALESALRQALAQGQFQVYFQAQLFTPKGSQMQVSGAEILVRWLHPKQGMIPPAEFIPVAEASGQIIALGQWVLHSACRQIAQWEHEPRTRDLTVSVNVSPLQFHQSNFVAVVLQTLTETSANPRRLKLELTEGMLVANIDDVILKMNALKSMGIQFSLDDFGTGYSSLSYLKRLPLDQLKIDQSFVRDVQTDPNDAVIAKTIIALGNNLGLSIIAEGVETEGQRQFLAAAGCHAFQGYLFGRPMPVDEFERLLPPKDAPLEA
jgi:diguanylate cyclase (GGDEF)-like protein